MKRALFLAATLVLSACSTVKGAMIAADTPPLLTAPSPPTAAYLRAAGESDVYEISSSQLALQRTQNPDVRRFATMLIDHHTMTTNVLLTAATRDRVAPPPAVLGPQKRALVRQLDAQTGTHFDRLYMQQQVMAHQEALAVHGGYARSGDAQALRGAAGTAVPIVRRHLTEAQGMQARMAAAGM